MDVNTQDITDAIKKGQDQDSQSEHLEQTDNNENVELQGDGNNQDDLVDLDSLDRFRWDGKEYTRDELGKMAMRQSDYTRKTQELAEEKKYAENFAADFRTLASQNFHPQLVEKFKELYPEKYHTMIDQFVEQSKPQTKEEKANLEAEIKKFMEPHLKDLNSIKQETYEKKVEAETKWLDNQFDTLGKKYPYANDELVNSKLIAMLDHAKQSGQTIQVTDKLLEKMFKQVNDAYKQKVEEINSRRAKEQSQVNQKAFDTTGRGGSPQMERKRVSFEEATQNAINSLTNN